MGEIVFPSVPSPEEDKNPFYLGKQCPYVGASALQPAQAQLCASRQSPHQAPGPQPVAPSPSVRPTLAPKVGWSAIPGTMGIGPCQPSRPGAGSLLWAEAQLLETVSSLLHGSIAAAAARQGRRGDINNSHTKEEGGGAQRAGASSPTVPGPGRCEHQRSRPALLPQPVWLWAAVRGRLCSEFGVCTSLGWPPPALTKASGLGRVYMMHSSPGALGSWLATLLFLPERRGRAPGPMGVGWRHSEAG